MSNIDFQNGFIAGVVSKSKLPSGTQSNVQADYNEDDPAQPGYIKNRPFYVAKKPIVVIQDIECQIKGEVHHSAGYVAQPQNLDHHLFELKEGRKYNITIQVGGVANPIAFNGVEAKNIKEIFGAGIIDVDETVLGLVYTDVVDRNDISFLYIADCYVDDNGYIQYQKNSSTYAMVLINDNNEYITDSDASLSVHLIPDDFVVSSEYTPYLQSDYDQSDKSALTYIKNRPFYKELLLDQEVVLDNSYYNAWNNYDGELELVDGGIYYARVYTGTDFTEYTFATTNLLDSMGANYIGYVAEDQSIAIVGGVNIGSHGSITEVDKGLAYFIASSDITSIVIYKGEFIKKIAREFLDLDADEMQADWNEEDESKNGYIKNKPFSVINDTIYMTKNHNLTTSTLAAGTGALMPGLDRFADLTIGETYNIAFTVEGQSEQTVIQNVTCKDYRELFNLSYECPGLCVAPPSVAEALGIPDFTSSTNIVFLYCNYIGSSLTYNPYKCACGTILLDDNGNSVTDKSVSVDIFMNKVNVQVSDAYADLLQPFYKRSVLDQELIFQNITPVQWTRYNKKIGLVAGATYYCKVNAGSEQIDYSFVAVDYSELMGSECVGYISDTDGVILFDGASVDNNGHIIPAKNDAVYMMANTISSVIIYKGEFIKKLSNEFLDTDLEFDAESTRPQSGVSVQDALTKFTAKMPKSVISSVSAPISIGDDHIAFTYESLNTSDVLNALQLNIYTKGIGLNNDLKTKSTGTLVNAINENVDKIQALSDNTKHIQLDALPTSHSHSMSALRSDLKDNYDSANSTYTPTVYLFKDSYIKPGVIPTENIVYNTKGQYFCYLYDTLYSFDVESFTLYNVTNNTSYNITDSLLNDSYKNTVIQFFTNCSNSIFGMKYNYSAKYDNSYEVYFLADTGDILWVYGNTATTFSFGGDISNVDFSQKLICEYLCNIQTDNTNVCSIVPYINNQNVWKRSFDNKTVSTTTAVQVQTIARYDEQSKKLQRVNRWIVSSSDKEYYKYNSTEYDNIDNNEHSQYYLLDHDTIICLSSSKEILYRNFETGAINKRVPVVDNVGLFDGALYGTSITVKNNTLFAMRDGYLYAIDLTVDNPVATKSQQYYTTDDLDYTVPNCLCDLSSELVTFMLPDGRIGGSLVRQHVIDETPDWNENDPHSPAYIKNRTHWTEETLDGEIIVHKLSNEYLNIDNKFNPTSENAQSGIAIAAYVDEKLGELNTLLDNIIAIQESLIGGAEQ